MTDPERWRRIQALFHRALALPTPEQLPFLTAECGPDAAMLDELRELLAEDSGTSWLDHGLSQAAARVFAPDPREARPPGGFGPYRLGRMLGEGGVGVVYLAERADLGSVAAIKILRDAWLSPARRERFRNEQRTLAQLAHPAIARLLDADTLDDGTPWFVMEYVEGVSLTEWCRARALPVPERLRLFRAVCEAVQHAHEHGVIHRDLKPGNILVTDSGQVKLLDFGIAKQMDHLELGGDPTRTELRLMTPAYAAPEQFGRGRAGMHTDVYSLGVILYELLAGKLPYDLTGLSPAEMETRIAEGAARKPSEAGGDVGMSRVLRADLDTLCLTAMHRDPARRYRTVAALIRDVDHLLGGEPLEARPDTTFYRVGKFVRRNRVPVAAATLVLLTVAALTVYYTTGLARARNSALAEAARTQRLLGFTLGLFQGGESEVGPADSLRALTLVDRGLQAARSLSAEPAVQSELYETLGRIYQQLGNLARADTLLRAAFDQRRKLFGERSKEVARSLVALGVLRVDEARLDAADTLVRGGLALSRATLPANHPDLARATSALSTVLQQQSRFPEAIAVSEAAVRLSPGSDAAPTTELASSLSLLADAHFYAGNYDASDSLNQRVLAMYYQLHGARHPLTAVVLLNLGASQFQRGEYAKAEEFDRRALAIMEGFYGPDHHETAHGLTMLGRALIAEEKNGEGEAALRRALAIRERVYGEGHPSVASTLNELGNNALVRGDYDAAEAAYLRVVEIYRRTYAPRHYLIGLGLANLASAYSARRNYAQAERLLREAVAIDVAAVGPDHVNTGIARIKLGRVLLRQRRFAEAVEESLAGYEVMMKLSDPGVSFVRAARTDLAAAYDTLGQADKAARFKAEQGAKP